jgi:hypothetical protein
VIDLLRALQADDENEGMGTMPGDSSMPGGSMPGQGSMPGGSMPGGDR